MTLNEYQEKAMTTCMESCDNFSYMFLNLVGEVGEFAGKVAKAIRKSVRTILEDELIVEQAGHQSIEDAISAESYSKHLNEELKKEAGDILWQLSGLCKVMGWTLEDVAQIHLGKLATRKANGTIDGSGDGVTKEERGVKKEKYVAPVSAEKVKKFTYKKNAYKPCKNLERLTRKPDRRFYKCRQELTKDGTPISAVYQTEEDLKIRGYRYGHKVFYAYGDYMKIKSRLSGRLF